MTSPGTSVCLGLALTSFLGFQDAAGAARERTEQAREAAKKDRAQALRILDDALGFWERSGDREGQAGARVLQGQWLNQSGKPEAGRKAFEAALALEPGPAARLSAHYGMAQSALALQQFPEALTALDLAMPIAERLQDTFRQGAIEQNRAAALVSMGRAEEAEAAYRRALALREKIQDDFGIALAWDGIGLTAYQQGDLQKALDSQREAILHWQKAKYPRGEANNQNSLGLVWQALGEPEKARAAQERALALYRQEKDLEGEARSLNNLGLLEAAARRWTRAVPLYDQALAREVQSKDARSEAYTRHNRGVALAALGRSEEARKDLEVSLRLKRQVGDRFAEAETLHELGVLNGEQELQAALALRREVGDRNGESRTLTELARWEARRGDGAAARAHAMQAVRLAEELRTGLVSPERRALYFATHRRQAALLIDLLVQEGDAAGAFEAAERSRARSLLDRLTERGVDPRAGAPRELREAVERSERRARAQAVLVAQRPGAAQEKRLAALLDEYQEAEARLRTASPRYSELVAPQAAGVDAVREKLLDARTVLVAYWLGEGGSYAWVVRREGVRLRHLGATAPIEAAAREVREALAERLRGAEGETPAAYAERRQKAAQTVERAAAALARRVIVPLGALARDSRLVVIPDEGLHGIPWALLPAGGEPLVERCEVVVAPSATLALALRERAGSRPAAWRAAVAADPLYRASDPRLNGGAGGDEGALPRLTESGREAAAVARWRPAALRLEGPAATRERVLAPDFHGRELLHFAAHARTEAEPVGLALSLRDAQGRPRDGWLRLPDLYRLDGHAELVVLSACASGLGRAVAGEGLLSLTRGFFSAGARRVLATLWSVEDAASAELMESFYAEMFGKGRTPAAALRAAQQAQRRKPHRAAPEHWAGYVLEGEWR